MGRNFDDYPGLQLMRSWVNTYAQDCTYLHSRWQKFSLTAKLSNLKEWNGRNYTHLEKVEWWSKEPLINLRQHLYFENFETHN